MPPQPVTTHFQQDRISAKLIELQQLQERFSRLSAEIMADLSDQLTPHSPSRKLHVIMDTVAAHYGVTVEDMQSQRRPQWIVRPRHVAMWVVRSFTAIPCAVIAEAFGGRDHGTVIHACRSIDSLRATDSTVKAQTDELLETCRSKIQTEDLPLFHLSTS